MIVCYWTKFRGRGTQKGYSIWCLKIEENGGKVCNTKKNRCRKCMSISPSKLTWFLWEAGRGYTLFLTAAQPNKMSDLSCLIRQKDTIEHIVSINRFICPLHLLHLSIFSSLLTKIAGKSKDHWTEKTLNFLYEISIQLDLKFKIWLWSEIFNKENKNQTINIVDKVIVLSRVLSENYLVDNSVKWTFRRKNR